MQRNSEMYENNDCFKNGWYCNCGCAHIGHLLTFLLRYGGEAPNERDDEHAINFLYESFGKKITFFVKYEAK